MDCPSEEQMIRMKLEDVASIQQLQFDIANRKLTVFHKNEPSLFDSKIHSLDLDSTLLETVETDESIPENSTDETQRKMLWWVLIINFTFFVTEMLYGWLGNSMGLIADSLDMLADSIVYGLSLLAVGAAVSRKKHIAKMSGYFQMVLAGLGLIEVIRRFMGFEAIPVFQTMMIVSTLALIANGVSLYLIQKTRSDDAHMQASMIFTSNDIIINAGVIIAGLLVYFTESNLPDLIVGAVIFLIVIRGAMRILKLAK